jgi:hypothetical protein
VWRACLDDRPMLGVDTAIGSQFTRARPHHRPRLRVRGRGRLPQSRDHRDTVGGDRTNASGWVPTCYPAHQEKGLDVHIQARSDIPPQKPCAVAEDIPIVVNGINMVIMPGGEPLG